MRDDGLEFLLVIHRQAQFAEMRLGQRGHGEDQLVDAGIEQHRAVRRMKFLDLMFLSQVPIIDMDLVAGADDTDYQCIALALEPQLFRGDILTEPETVRVGTICGIKGIRPARFHDSVDIILTAEIIAVAASPACQVIIGVATGETVVPGTAEQAVGSRTPVKPIISLASVEGIIAPLSIQDVIAGFPVDDIITPVGIDPIVTAAGIHPIPATARFDDIVRPVSVQGVIAAVSVNPVDPVGTDQDIASTVSTDDIRRCIGGLHVERETV